MKLKKCMASLAILMTTGLFSADISSIDQLIDKINSTTDVEIKSNLMEELDSELKSLNEKDAEEAKKLVTQKLKISTES